MNYIDVHAHLNDKKYSENLESVISNADKSGVKRIINVGFDLPSSEKARELADKYENMYFCAGVHPDEAKTFNEEVYSSLKELTAHKKCVAIGEIGFDFHWMSSTEEEQRYAFDMQMRLADEAGLPFVVHSRDASAKTLAFLQERKSLINHGFLMHCYSESAESSKLYLDMGAYFSFGGVITFKNAKKEEIIKSIGTGKILSETDCPYLTPEPYRGTVNEPARIIYVVKKLAEIFCISEEEMTNIIGDNAEKLFFRLKCV